MKQTKQNIEDLAKCLRASDGIITREKLIELVDVYDCKVCFRINEAELSHTYLDRPLIFKREGENYCIKK